MTQQIIRRVMIDPNLDNYKTFFDHEWSQAFYDFAENSAFQMVAFDLCYTWKSIATAHASPWIMIQTLQELADGVRQRVAKNGLSIVSEFGERVTKALPDDIYGMTSAMRRQATSSISRIRREVEHEAGFKINEFPRESAWQSILNSSSDIQMGIWGNQRLCYGSLYHAYEDFIRSLIAVRLGQPDYRLPRYVDSVEVAKKHFGTKVVAECIEDEDVKTARFVRHALAHNGGKITKDLKNRRHGLEMCDEVLQVQAIDTRVLFDLLKPKATKLLDAAISTPNTP